jgi:Protein of unknown function (DUF2786)
MPNDAVLTRVRKLLAMAEHPRTPPAEAESAATAAERLIAKYAIDEALLEAASATRSMPQTRTFVIESPYASAKTILVSSIAGAHGVRAVTLGGTSPTRMTLVGFAGDLQVVELLYTSLLLQATTSLRRQNITGRAFRRAFLIGFASEIGRRLEATREAAVAESGAPSTDLVLRDRQREVDEALNTEFPRLRRTRTTISDGRGLNAGRASGAAANLASGRNQVGRHDSALQR